MGLPGKRGESWAVGPNPIPIDYMTRAGLLWKNGETYIKVAGQALHPWAGNRQLRLSP